MAFIIRYHVVGDAKLLFRVTEEKDSARNTVKE